RKTWRGVIEEYGHFLKVIKLCAGLNKNLVSLRRRSVLHFNNAADVQARRIDTVLACRHDVIVNFHFFDSGNVTHLDHAHTEIRASTYRAEGAGLSELAHDCAGSGFLVCDQHDLRRPRTDGDDASDDPAGRDDRHVHFDSRGAAAIDRDRVEPDGGIARDHASGNALDVRLLVEIQQGFETV